MDATQTLQRDDLLTNCERSMRYHQARRRFFDSAHSLIQFIVFALANVGVFSLLEAELPASMLPWILATVGLLALWSLVYNPAAKMSLHTSLHRDFTMLASTIASRSDPDEQTRAGWTVAIHALYAKEPPVLRALNAHCNNQMVIMLGSDDGYLVDLSWRHRLLRNFFSFQRADFSNRNQAHQ